MLVFYRVFILGCDNLVTQKSVHLAGICPDRCGVQIKKGTFSRSGGEKSGDERGKCEIIARDSKMKT